MSTVFDLKHTGPTLVNHYQAKYENDFGKVLREDMRENR